MTLVDPVVTDLQPDDPEQIGAFRLIRRIGEGGMGTVWLAEQSEPFLRQVALKAIKEGLNTREVIARFDAERNALGQLDHPNIARALDAGTSENGLPFFVMEFVDGPTITEFCDEQRLGIRDRLELFLQVCRGFQHAHEAGIIHRDVKPSNILVEQRGGSPIAKIIDFGVAKALDRRLTEATLNTEVGRLIGTPEYMSPEQAGLTGKDVDARSDVYSLGVLLYEILVGALPFDAEAAREKGYFELQRQICETDPATPSRRLTTSSGDRRTAAAAARNTSPSALGRMLRGDLDQLLLRALEKDPEARYPSVAEFAADIGRHLAGEPISGTAPIQRRARRVMRRHGSKLAASAIVVLVGSLATMLFLERRKNDRLIEQLTDSRKAAEDMAPMLPVVGDAIDYEIHQTLSNDQLRVQKISSSIPHFEKAVELTKQIDGNISDAHADALGDLGRAQLAAGMPKAALNKFEQARSIRLQLTPVDQAAIAQTYNDIGAALAATKNADGALDAYSESLRRFQRAPGDHSDAIATAEHNIGATLLNLEEFDEAEPHLERASAIRERRMGTHAPASLDALSNYARANTHRMRPRTRFVPKADLTRGHEQVQHEEKLRAIEKRLTQALGRQQSDNKHDPRVLRSGHALAQTKAALGELDEALQLQMAIHDALENRPGDDPMVVCVRSEIVDLVARTGSQDAARVVFQLVEPELDKLQGADLHTLRAREAAARALESIGKQDEAARHWIAIHTDLEASGARKIRVRRVAAEVDRLIHTVSDEQLRSSWTKRD